MKSIATSSAPTNVALKKQYRSTSKSKSGRVRKGSREKREQGKVLEKLRGMVGSDEHASQLELMQNVLDHIYSLKAALESDGEPMEEHSDLQTLIAAFASSLSPKSLSPEPASP